MAKFKKFDSKEQIAGLADAALQIQVEDLVRAGKMPSLAQVVDAIEETNLEICVEFFKTQGG